MTTPTALQDVGATPTLKPLDWATFDALKQQLPPERHDEADKLSYVHSPDEAVAIMRQWLPAPAVEPAPTDVDSVETGKALANGGIFGLIGRISKLGLTPNQLAVYLYFIGCRNKKTGQAWQGMRLVAKHAGMSLSTVQEARDVLIAAGLLAPVGKQTEKRRHGRESNSYHVNLPSRADLAMYQQQVAAARESARLARKSRETKQQGEEPRTAVV